MHACTIFLHFTVLFLYLNKCRHTRSTYYLCYIKLIKFKHFTNFLTVLKLHSNTVLNLAHTPQFINLYALHNLLVVVVGMGFSQMQAVELLPGKPIDKALYLS